MLERKVESVASQGGAVMSRMKTIDTELQHERSVRLILRCVVEY